jgi:hypothetical protein
MHSLFRLQRAFGVEGITLSSYSETTTFAAKMSQLLESRETGQVPLALWGQFRLADWRVRLCSILAHKKQRDCEWIKERLGMYSATTAT